MEKKVIYCDICGSEDAFQFSFAVDSQMDGAGDTDTIHERVDLCPKCCAAQLELFIAALPWTARQVLVGKIRNRALYLSHMSRAERRNGGTICAST